MTSTLERRIHSITEISDIDMSVQLSTGLRISNPVMIASGTFGYDGYGDGVIEFHPVHQLGAIVIKTVTKKSLNGNPAPRVFNHDRLFINSCGLENSGIEMMTYKLSHEWTKWNANIIVSLAAHSMKEFYEMTNIANNAVGICGIELNLSCPNVPNGAVYSHDPALTREVVKTVKANTKLPVLAKLSPNVPDIIPIVKAAIEGGVDAITICNTMPAMKVDTVTQRPVLGNITGGLSGDYLRPISVALVYQATKAIKDMGADIPVIGVGGIFNVEHALEYFFVGASAIQIGSANVTNSYTPWQILNDMRQYMLDNNIHSINEIRGMANLDI